MRGPNKGEMREEERMTREEERWTTLRHQRWAYPEMTNKKDNKRKVNKNAWISKKEKRAHRKRYGATRGSYMMGTQTRLRPQTISEGGDFHFTDIRTAPTKAYRILFQNLGGYSADNTQRITDLTEVKECRADYIGLQETKINETHKPMIKRTEAQFHKYLGAKTIFKSNNDSYSESYWKPGGLASLTMRSLRGGSIKVWTDPAAIIMKTRIEHEGINLSIINIYLPKFNAGPTSSYTQTLNTIRKLGNWKMAAEIESYFYATLTKCVQEESKAKYRVIVGGDFNDEHKTESAMTKNMEGLGLINITSPPNEKTPPTFKHGKRTIDHIWIAQEVSPVITGYGYLAFDYGFTADHRGMFIDIGKKGWEETKVNRKARRKLKSKNPISVERYLKAVWKRVIGQNVEARIAKMEGKETLTPEEVEELDKVDQTMTNIMKVAETELQQRRSNDYTSDDLNEIKRTRYYWKRLWRLTGADSHYSLRKYFPLHKEENITMSRKEIKTKIMKAGIEIERIREAGYEKREKMLKEKAKHEAKRQGRDDTENKGITAMLNAEKSRRKYAELRRFKHPKYTQTREIEVPNGVEDVDTMWRILKEDKKEADEIEWRKIKDKDETTEFLIRWCIRHFGQAAETPLYEKGWRNALDPRTASNIVNEVIEGRMKTPEGYPPEFTQFLRASKKPKGTTEVTFKMTFEHFERFCKKQDEKKESSPSGLHYGHLKALAYDARLLRMKYKIIELAYKNGIILTRWKTLWEILIPKKQRSYIHKFRNITLVEGDVQYIMKAMWSSALMKAVTPVLQTTQNALRGRVTQSGVLSHRIALDTIFVLGEECIIIENDAVNCFDRILPHIAAMAFMRLGMVLGMVTFYLNFLEAAEHSIILGGEPTERKYAHSESTPILGSGQGTGWAGPSWYAVSDIIFTGLTENQPGIYLESPDRNTKDFRTAEASVDDARQGVNTSGVEKFNRENGTNLTLIQAANRACQGFERYLTLTGGKFALDKTMCYVLIPDMGGMERRYLGGKEIDLKLELNENFKGTTTTLNRYQPEEAHKMLGIYTDPASTLKEQKEYMTAQAKEWNTRMLGSTLDSSAKWLSYRTELCPRLRYSLPAISLTEAECKRILHPAIPSIKHGLGISRTAPNEVIHFPHEFGGYGVMDLHIEKLAEQTRYIVQHLRNNDSLGKRVLISIGTTQMESGINQHIERNGRLARMKYVTPTILTELIEELWLLKAEIWFDHWVPGKGDTIMEIVRKESRSAEQIREINVCRTWLQVHYISDIITMDGKKIHPGYENCKRVRTSSWTWPRWRPPHKVWGTWKGALHSYIKSRLPKQNRTRGHQQIRSWVDRELTGVTSDGKEYQVTKSGRRKVLKEGPTNTPKPVPCDIHDYGGRIELIAYKEIGNEDPGTTKKRGTFLEELIRREPTMKGIFKNLPHAEQDHQAIAELIREDRLVAGSDGGDDQDGRIVFSITIAADDLLDIHTSSHEIDGGPKDSGRAEMMGVMTTIIYLIHVIEWHSILIENEIPIYCDNREAVDFCQHKWLGTTPRWADERNVELKRTIEKYLGRLGRRIKVYHVDGHQDRHNAQTDLKLPAKVNIICDEGCTERLRAKQGKERETTRRDPMTSEIATLKIDGIPVTTGYKKALYEKKYSERVAKHLGLTMSLFERIDWEGHARAMKSTGGPALKRVVWGQHPTYSHLKIVGKSTRNNCPLCDEVDTRDHFLVCQVINGSARHKKLRDEKRHLAHKNGFPDHMIKMIVEVMEGRGIDDVNIPRDARKIYEEQTRIGWRNMSLGRITRKWSEIRKTDSSGRMRTGKRWRAQAITVILGWLYEKWNIRCRMCQEPGEDFEHKAILEECMLWWGSRETIGLMRGDAHLRNQRQKPRQKHNKEYLREWLRTRKIAKEAYGRYAPNETQPTLHRWLVHSTKETMEG